MDVFERRDAHRRLLEKNVTVVWVEFRLGIDSLLASYNASESGKLVPASLKEQPHTRSLLVSRTEPRATKDRFGDVTIAIHITLEAAQYRINAVAEKWVSRYEQLLRSEKKQEFVFSLAADVETGSVWIEDGMGKHFMPAEAAEHILGEAFSDQF